MLEAVQPGAPYEKRWRGGLAPFRGWLRRSRTSVPLTRENHRGIDDTLTMYEQAFFDSRVDISVARHAILAVQKLLFLREQLKRCCKSLRGWQSRCLALTPQMALFLGILAERISGKRGQVFTGVMAPVLGPPVTLSSQARTGLTCYRRLRPAFSDYSDAQLLKMTLW